MKMILGRPSRPGTPEKIGGSNPPRGHCSPCRRTMRPWCNMDPGNLPRCKSCPNLKRLVAWSMTMPSNPRQTTADTGNLPCQGRIRSAVKPLRNTSRPRPRRSREVVPGTAADQQALCRWVPRHSHDEICWNNDGDETACRLETN
jgi:hypothetical protein